MRGRGTLVGFLLTCFAVVGLAGVFASFAVPLPYERALIRLGAAQDANAAAAILRDAARESQYIAFRVRILLAVLTLVAAAFGAMLLLIGRGAAPSAVSGATSKLNLS